MKILFFVESIFSASSRYRVIQYKEFYKKNGIKVKYFYLLNKHLFKFKQKYGDNVLGRFLYIVLLSISTIKRLLVLLFIAPFFDIIHVNREFIHRFLIPYDKYLNVFGCKLVYEFDDSVFLNLGAQNRVDYYIKNSDLIICGNKRLKDYANKLNENCIIIPTVVKKDEYLISEKANNNKREETFIIGWIGSPSTIHNLDIVINPLNKIIEKYSNIKFKFICDAPHGYLEKIDKSYFQKWYLNNHVKELNEIDVGIMPLFETEFNKGKCGFKLIQYIALGKPILASNIGVNKEIINNSRAGFICDDQEEWFEKLELLYLNINLRKEKSKNALNSFKEIYNAETQFQKIKKSLVKLTNEK